jgi:predicted polyphosphate/ATP-dependent NAD kinase
LDSNSSALVGIIANPASGKDIRRVVSQATTVNNHEKVSIVRRVLLALHASGIRRVAIMPDYFDIGDRALHGLGERDGIRAMTSLIEMPVAATAADSETAARHLAEAGAGCIIVLGGDGTCRAVAKGCGEVPLLPISTGTNNVVPFFVEGTVAGAAAAYVALVPEMQRDLLCFRHKRLLVYVDGREVDQALVEVALVSAGFLGARAVWEASTVRQVFATRAQPVNIGLSAIAGIVHPIEVTDPEGVAVSLSPGGQEVMVPLVPGGFERVTVGSARVMHPGVQYAIAADRPAALTLDGEREILLHHDDQAYVMLDLEGPWIVDVKRALLRAVQDGMFQIPPTSE